MRISLPAVDWEAAIQTFALPIRLASLMGQAAKFLQRLQARGLAGAKVCGITWLGMGFYNLDVMQHKSKEKTLAFYSGLLQSHNVHRCVSLAQLHSCPQAFTKPLPHFAPPRTLSVIRDEEGHSGLWNLSTYSGLATLYGQELGPLSIATGGRVRAALADVVSAART